MNGATISIAAAGDNAFRGYLSIPASGSGPGLILLHEIFGLNQHIRDLADTYAEEGYVVLAPDLFWKIRPGIELGHSEEDLKTALTYRERFDVEQAIVDIRNTLQALRANPACTGKVGAIGFSTGGLLAYLAAARLPVDAAVAYHGVGIDKHLGEAKSIRCPIALHFGSEDEFVSPTARAAIKQVQAENDDAEVYVYRGIGHSFHDRGRKTFDRSAASLAHSRTISLLRRAVGPRYDLDALWEKHLEGEFVTCDADATIRTMVPRAYVNHVPTMIGGFGARELHRYYKYHFIPQNQGSRMIPVSRTIGADRLVDEFIACFKHEAENDTLLPGIKPTGKEVRIPMVAIVQFRGDKLCSEHLYWDQASVLVQLGLLDPAQLPVTGGEAADRVIDEELPLNTLRAEHWWKKSEGRESAKSSR
ncbi:MAG TPA: dienelactone hydrolase family protein [Candidatus Binataceae bacterium]|nr:dienelactone hydrolase family protein [Candidatus Binataceae bacterium]